MDVNFADGENHAAVVGLCEIVGTKREAAEFRVLVVPNVLYDGKVAADIVVRKDRGAVLCTYERVLTACEGDSVGLECVDGIKRVVDVDVTVRVEYSLTILPS